MTPDILMQIIAALYALILVAIIAALAATELPPLLASIARRLDERAQRRAAELQVQRRLRGLRLDHQPRK